jgi:hypothetical protein
VEEQWDVRSTGSLPAPCFALGIFMVERRGALPPLGPSVQDKLPEFPTLIGPPRALGGNQVFRASPEG